ncbi:MAG: magnesium transporter CorA family protein [Rubrivivax sp.]|nr:magnesium transporter CorA family protein [Rubrivivax sp.]
MQVFHIVQDQFAELPDLPQQLPEAGFLWIGTGRREFEVRHAELQAALLRWTGAPLVDLHVADLLNIQLPSHYDYTSSYDLMVFRRLAASAAPAWGGSTLQTTAEEARQTLQAIDTSPVGFAVFDRVLLTVHPADCAVREYFAQRLSGQQGTVEARGASRMPAGPADLMLRMVNHMVDSYLDLRRLLTRQLSTLQRELLDPKSRFNDWQVLLDSRNALHELEDTCEDQRSAVQEWLDALDEWPLEPGADKQRERELLRVRTRDVLEHVERVLSHVRRLEQSAEVAVQMHFSALGHRTNDIMRTLTALTAVFLPLNLITGFFGMNFDGLPLIHTETGVWIAAMMMLVVVVGLGGFFWRRRYLGSARRH